MWWGGDHTARSHQPPPTLDDCNHPEPTHRYCCRLGHFIQTEGSTLLVCPFWSFTVYIYVSYHVLWCWATRPRLSCCGHEVQKLLHSYSTSADLSFTASKAVWKFPFTQTSLIHLQATLSLALELDQATWQHTEDQGRHGSHYSTALINDSKSAASVNNALGQCKSKIRMKLWIWFALISVCMKMFGVYGADFTRHNEFS